MECHYRILMQVNDLIGYEGNCTWMQIDLGKNEIVSRVVLQHACDGTTASRRTSHSLEVELSMHKSSGFIKALLSYGGGVTFFPRNHYPNGYFTCYDKIWQLFATTVNDRYIKFVNKYVTFYTEGSPPRTYAFFDRYSSMRAGVVIWPDFACSACPSNTFKNYVGSRNLKTECTSCPDNAFAPITGRSSYSCNANSYVIKYTCQDLVCQGCGRGSFMFNDTCNECAPDTSKISSVSGECQVCLNSSKTSRVTCDCPPASVNKIYEINPDDNKRHFSLQYWTSSSGNEYSRLRLDFYWIHDWGGGFSGWIPALH
jgi:hypothetical protein